jgi:hypothetical protein
MPVQIFSQHGHQVVMSPVPMPDVYDPLRMKTGALLQFYRPSGSETVRTQGMAGNVWRHILVEIPAFSWNDFEINKCCTSGVSVKGVGIFFHHETHDGAKFPVVRSITEKGSASRQGSIATGEILLRVDGLSCRDWDSKELQNKVRSGSAMLNTCSIGGAVYYEEIKQELNRILI